MEKAQANLISLNLDLENTKIKAPFEGTLQSRAVEVGDYLQVGDPVAVIVDRNPLVVTGDVYEKDIHHLKMGMQGYAELNSGEKLEGTIRYLAVQSDPKTRTFTLELEVPNPDSALPAGQTAKITIPTGATQAHKLSPALLSLNDAGDLGIKIVDDEQTVQFLPATIIKSSANFIWLGGLPQSLQLISVGQGFANEGELVKVDYEEPSSELITID